MYCTFLSLLRSRVQTENDPLFINCLIHNAGMNLTRRYSDWSLMQTRGITPLTHNHLKPISESPEIVYSCSVSRWPRPVFWEREWNTSVSRLSQVTSRDVRESCHKSPARFAFDAMQGGCKAPSRHISPTHAFIWCRETACSCVNLKRKTPRRSRASWWSSVSEKWTYASVFSTSLLHFFFSRYILSKLASDCIPLFPFNLWSPLQWSIRSKEGNPNCRKRASVSFSNCPLTLNIWSYGEECDPVNGSPCPSRQRHEQQPPPQGEQGGMCAFLNVCVWTDSVPTEMTFNRHLFDSHGRGRSYCYLNFSSVCPQKQQHRCSLVSPF